MQPDLAEPLDDLDDIVLGVVLLQCVESRLIKPLDGGGDEDAPRLLETRNEIVTLDEMLNLDSDVVRDMLWAGPLKKSGSPKVTWVAPALTCWRMSASTTSRCTTRKRPSYTGTIGQ